MVTENLQNFNFVPQQKEGIDMNIQSTPTKLRGVTGQMIRDVERATDCDGYVSYVLLPGRTDSDRSDYFWVLHSAGLIDDYCRPHREWYQCTSCERYFVGGDTYVTDYGDEWCYADNGNGCYERIRVAMWSPPDPVTRVDVPLSEYRVTALVREIRSVWVQADNPTEAARMVAEEDWYDEGFLCESQWESSEDPEVMEVTHNGRVVL